MRLRKTKKGAAEIMIVTCIVGWLLQRFNRQCCQEEDEDLKIRREKMWLIII